MSSLETIQEGLKALGDALGVQLELDEDNVCGLEFHDGLGCTIELGAGDDSLFLYGELLPVTPSDRQRLFQQALSLNLYGLETGGASIALDEDGSSLVLCYRLPAPLLSAQQFRDLVADFVLRIQSLRDRLRAEVPNQTASDSASEIDRLDPRLLPI